MTPKSLVVMNLYKSIEFDIPKSNLFGWGDWLHEGMFQYGNYSIWAQDNTKLDSGKMNM